MDYAPPLVAASVIESVVTDASRTSASAEKPISSAAAPAARDVDFKEDVVEAEVLCENTDLLAENIMREGVVMEDAYPEPDEELDSAPSVANPSVIEPVRTGGSLTPPLWSRNTRVVRLRSGREVYLVPRRSTGSPFYSSMEGASLFARKRSRRKELKTNKRKQTERKLRKIKFLQYPAEAQTQVEAEANFTPDTEVGGEAAEGHDFSGHAASAAATQRVQTTEELYNEPASLFARKRKHREQKKIHKREQIERKRRQMERLKERNAEAEAQVEAKAEIVSEMDVEAEVEAEAETEVAGRKDLSCHGASAAATQRTAKTKSTKRKTMSSSRKSTAPVEQQQVSHRPRNAGTGKDADLHELTLKRVLLMRKLQRKQIVIPQLETDLKDNSRVPAWVVEQRSVGTWRANRKAFLQRTKREHDELLRELKVTEDLIVLYRAARRWYIDHGKSREFFKELREDGYDTPEKIVRHFWKGSPRVDRDLLLDICVTESAFVFDSDSQKLESWRKAFASEERFNDYFEYVFSEKASA